MSDCNHCMEDWSTDADGEVTEVHCKHCGIEEPTNYGRALLRIEELEAAAAAREMVAAEPGA